MVTRRAAAARPPAASAPATPRQRGGVSGLTTAARPLEPEGLQQVPRRRGVARPLLLASSAGITPRFSVSTTTKTNALPAYYSNARPELTQLVNRPGMRILEVGCAAGAMGEALLAKGAVEVVGIDIFEPALAIARKRLSAVHRVDLDQLPVLPYPEGHFDLITFADVLEHLVDPPAVLRHLRRWLADDGQILLSIPNVRHESVVLPLLVDGDWEYADCGILDRTHLRFYTRSGLLKLLKSSGFALDGKMAGVQTGVPPYVEKALELVKALGGDPKQFLEECDVVQFVAFARPTGPRPVQALPPPTASAAAADPWEGSRPTRILVLPDLQVAEDCCAAALPAIADGVRSNPGITLGVALPAAGLAEPPPVVRSLPAKHELDLLLTELPVTPRGWEALLRGAHMLVLTAPRPEVDSLAHRLGVPVHHAWTDPEILAAAGGAPSRTAPPLS
jgi:SAM-dependent methyltransferase